MTINLYKDLIRAVDSGGGRRAPLAFMLLCDDTTREYGNPEKAEKMRKACAENGWIPVSMRDDWKTISGDNVSKTQLISVH